MSLHRNLMSQDLPRYGPPRSAERTTSIRHSPERFKIPAQNRSGRIRQTVCINHCMPRALRPQIHGGIYHVMNRGNRKSVIFDDSRDRKRFFRGVIDAAKIHRVEILCGTEMTTHFHMIVHTPHANISSFMQQLEGEFAQYINWRHKRVGHLFQGPFKGVVIENDIHLFTGVWYVLANPCKGRLVERFEDWPWSTYAATAGFRPVPEYLSLSWLQTLFPAESLTSSQRLFRKCMEQPEPVIAYLLAVDPTLDVAIRSYVSERLQEMRLPRPYRALFRPPLDHLFWPDQAPAERNRAIKIARVTYGYKVAEIACVVGLNPSSVGKICRAPGSIPDGFSIAADRIDSDFEPDPE
jgi:putative transposase